MRRFAKENQENVLNIKSFRFVSFVISPRLCAMIDFSITTNDLVKVKVVTVDVTRKTSSTMNNIVGFDEETFVFLPLFLEPKMDCVLNQIYDFEKPLKEFD